LSDAHELHHDPIEILALREQFRQKGLEFTVHADAAWGRLDGVHLAACEQGHEDGVGARAVVATDVDAWDAYEWCQEWGWMARRFWDDPIAAGSLSAQLVAPIRNARWVIRACGEDIPTAPVPQS